MLWCSRIGTCLEATETQQGGKAGSLPLAVASSTSPLQLDPSVFMCPSFFLWRQNLFGALFRCTSTVYVLSVLFLVFGLVCFVSTLYIDATFVWFFFVFHVREQEVHSMDALYCFEVFSANRRSYMLQAEGPDELKSWVVSIRRTIESQARNKKP